MSSPTLEALFDEVAGLHGPMIRRIAASYEADPEVRRELQQDILMAIWRALPSWRGEASVRTFAARVAHNRGVDHVARHAKAPRTVELDEALPLDAPSAQEVVERGEQRERLMRAVRALPLPLRQVTVLTLEDFTPSEIADVLGVGGNVVSIRLTRAKAALRQAMQEQERA